MIIAETEEKAAFIMYTIYHCEILFFSYLLVKKLKLECRVSCDRTTAVAERVMGLDQVLSSGSMVNLLISNPELYI